MGILDHLTCLLRNLYAGLEATVRTGHRTTDWFQTGKEYIKAVYCHPTYLTYLCMKYSLGISNFLEEISSLSHSIVFLLFLCIDH